MNGGVSSVICGKKLKEQKTKGKFGNVSQGFVSASLLFCVGAMTILGSLESGLTGDHSILYTKSLLDMISSFVFATTLGFGVFLSGFFVLIFQGSITLLATWIEPLLSGATINEMSAVGSLLIVALSLNMLGLTKIKLANTLPAMLLAVVYTVGSTGTLPGGGQSGQQHGCKYGDDGDHNQ